MTHALYCDIGTCKCFVLWQWYVYMFCIVTVVRVHVLYCESGACTCFVSWQWYVYMFCIVTVVRVHVLYCDSGTCTCFVLWQWCVYMFCTVTVVRVHVLYRDSVRLEKRFVQHWVTRMPTHLILKVLIQAVTGAFSLATIRSSPRCAGRSWDSFRALFFIRNRDTAAAIFTLTFHRCMSTAWSPASSNSCRRDFSSSWSRGRNRLLYKSYNNSHTRFGCFWSCQTHMGTSVFDTSD